MEAPKSRRQRLTAAMDAYATRSTRCKRDGKSQTCSPSALIISQNAPPKMSQTTEALTYPLRTRQAAREEELRVLAAPWPFPRPDPVALHEARAELKPIAIMVIYHAYLNETATCYIHSRGPPCNSSRSTAIPMSCAHH